MKTPSVVKSPPSDQAIRDRFVTEVGYNYSVIAPAGVGKTKAIVDRIVTIAKGPDAKELLPRLVVVTYTKKAADEMHQRARNAIIESRVELAVLAAFNRAFFGTIHSFCVRLLRTHGHLLGLPAALDAVENDDELWRAFVRQLDVIAPEFPAAGKQSCLRFLSLEQILKLARVIRREHEHLAAPPSGASPMPRLDALLAFQPKGSAKKSIPRIQDALRRWREVAAGDAPFVPLPENPSSAKEFCELWQSAFGPLEQWLKDASRALAIALARDYRAYRLTQGSLTYDDQIALVLDLVRDPRAAIRLRAENFCVILDEAQDTDPTQFNVLLEIARPKNARGIWFEDGGEPPAAGRFCMVGDPQQSIYGSRADLAQYEAIRKRLVAAKAAEEINFDVTFRCDRAIIETVNALAPPMLHGDEGQAKFYELRPRPGAGPGQVIRIAPALASSDGGDNETKVGKVALHEARELAKWMKAQGLEKFGAHTWSDVAVLCPRRDWLATMQEALHEEGLVPQVHSDKTVHGDSAAYAWFTALATVMDRPRDGFELAGVLREIYGLSDDALARFTDGDGENLNIEAPQGSGEVFTVLQELTRLRTEIVLLPLREAMQRMVDATELRARVGIIGEEASEIDGLLALASVAEARGDSFRAFAEQLRDSYDAEIPAQPVQKDAVQLFTCHKAKGLQWEAVILPMLFRKISSKVEYPDILQGPPGQPPRIVFSRDDVGDLDEVLDRKRRHENQRLLYVALTRAKKSLVLVDDHALFSEKKDSAGSFADLLGLLDNEGHEVFNATWSELPEELVAPKREQREVTEPHDLGLSALRAEQLARAQQRSADAPTRVLPYALAEAQHEREERRDEDITQGDSKSPDAEAARLYGIWWHELVEAMDWRGDAEVREAVAHGKLASCPQPERGRREWKLLCDSRLMERLVPADAVVHIEMPFQFSRSEREWMEGVMDLAIFYPSLNRWLILDWKTNAVTAENAGSLRELYAPQLEAYAEALRAITKLPIAVGVYSTATGVWLPFD